VVITNSFPVPHTETDDSVRFCGGELCRQCLTYEICPLCSSPLACLECCCLRFHSLFGSASCIAHKDTDLSPPPPCLYVFSFLSAVPPSTPRTGRTQCRFPQ
jgi:hypothetical protein